MTFRVVQSRKLRSTASRDLVLRPRDPGVTLTQWLYRELRCAILDGRLARGSRLLPTRDLAAQYTLSRRIVVNVFEQLRDEGYVVSKAGGGTIVSDSVPEDFLTAKSAPRPKPPRDPILQAEAANYRRPARPFRPMEPGLAEFPVDLWARVTGRAMRRISTAVLAGGDIAGYRPLRQAIADYLGASRGVACTPDHIVVTSGTQQSLDLLARLLLQPGDAVWMEDPGYSGALDAFRGAGANIIPVSVDEHGLDPELGRRAYPYPRAIYLTPAHQFPLGATLRLDRKLDILQYARRHNIAVIEDDYDSEFRFSGKPVPAMKGLQGADHVFLLGTFNKMLFPSLRLGYMALPDSWIDPALRLRWQADRFPPGVSQVALTSFMDGGHFGKHLRRMRQLYGARREALQSGVRQFVSGAVRLPELQAGLNTPAILVNGMNSQTASQLATANRVEVWPLDRFSIARQDIHGLILGVAAFTEREIGEGVRSLAKALATPTELRR